MLNQDDNRTSDDLPASNWRFAGFVLPTTTPVPDQFFDELLAVLTPPEVVVCLYIIRRTFGFKKDSDSISLKQIAEGITTRSGRVLDRGTGLSKATIARALKSLDERGVIIRIRRRSNQKGDEPTTYRLNILSPVSHSETPPVSPVRHPRVSGLNTQETVLQQTVRQDLSNNRKTSQPAENGDAQKEESASEDPQASSFRQVKLEDDFGEGNDEQTAPAVPPGFAKVGKVLAQKRLPPRDHGDVEARDVVLSYIADFAIEMGDEAKLSSSVTRALNLYHKSGVDVGAFTSALYEARRRTKEYTGNIKKRQHSEGSYAPKNKMPYFFGVLEQLLGLKEEQPRSVQSRSEHVSSTPPSTNADRTQNRSRTRNSI